MERCAGPEMSEALTDRVEQLEIKLSFNEDLMDTLNTTIFRQQEQIDSLVKEIRHLRDRLQDQHAARDASGATIRDLAAEIPPHY